MQIIPRDLVISVCIIAIVFILPYVIKKKFRIISWNSFCLVVFTLFMSVIFSLTGISPISGFDLNHIGEGVDFVPIIGIVQMLKGGIDFYSITNIAGNILMFVPVGFFAPVLYHKYERSYKAVLLGISISLLIECSQLFLARGTDINDLILNTLGAMIGYWVYRLYRVIFPKLSKHIALANQNNSKVLFWACVAVPYLVIVLCGFYDRARFFR